MTRPKQPAEVAEFWTFQEVCQRYQIAASTLRGLVESGDFPPMLRISRSLRRFRVADVLAWESGRWVRAGDQAARSRVMRSSVFRRRAPAGTPPRRRGGSSAD